VREGGIALTVEEAKVPRYAQDDKRQELDEISNGNNKWQILNDK
jgi:hypothetical protein